MAQRSVEKFNDGIWSTCEFVELKTGDTFRMFEPNGEPVTNSGKCNFVAKGEPYENENAILEIECE